MKSGHKVKKLFSLLTAVLLVLSMAPAAFAAPQARWEATILFTHDLHSHFLPQDTEDGGQSGGYARLKTAIDREKAQHPDALLLDGGDFSIGSLIQTRYVDEGAELRTMGALGYDVGTIGNHEFDHKGAGFAQMLRSAVSSGTLYRSWYAPTTGRRTTTRISWTSSGPWLPTACLTTPCWSGAV